MRAELLEGQSLDGSLVLPTVDIGWQAQVVLRTDHERTHVLASGRRAQVDGAAPGWEVCSGSCLWVGVRIAGHCRPRDPGNQQAPRRFLTIGSRHGSTDLGITEIGNGIASRVRIRGCWNEV